MAAVTDRPDTRLDAERAVLGSMLIDPGVVRQALAKVDERDFLNSANRLIFQTARFLFRNGAPVDSVSIRDKIGEQYTDYLIQLMDITPTSASWEYYANAMHDQAAMQQVRDLADKLSAAVQLDDCRPLAAELMGILADGRKADAWNMREMLDSFYESQDPDAPAAKYITCGLGVVDDGSYIEPGDVIVLGGYPSDGKTAMALMMAYHMAKTMKVGFFSLETDKKKLRDRLISHVAQIDFNDIKRRSVDEPGWKSLADMAPDMANRDLTVLRGSGMTATEIQAISQAYGFQVIFVDYVQLIKPEISQRASRSDQMADVSRALHTFAQTSGTLVVELAQLSRPEKGVWREPDMNDLKESGQFEQDADMIFLLYRPNPKDEDLDRDRHRILKIAKNKEGRLGRWPLYFDGATQTFSIMVGSDGKSVMRKLVNDGKKIKAKNHQEAKGQQLMAEFREIPENAAPDAPF